MMDRWIFLTPLTAVLILAACGGPPRAARIAIEQTAGGLVVADTLVADAVRERGQGARAQVLNEVLRGDIEGGTPEETRSLAMSRWDALMKPTTDARAGLRSAREGLSAVELAIDAWAAGSGSEGDFLRVAACAVAAIAEAVQSMEAAGLEMPAAVTGGIDLVAGFAAGGCEEEN